MMSTISRLSPSASPTPIREDRDKTHSEGAKAGSAARPQAAPAAATLDSNLMDLLRRSQKATPPVTVPPPATATSTPMVRFPSQQFPTTATSPPLASSAPSSLDYSSALAAAVAAGRRSTLFQGQGSAATAAPSTADLMFLLEQQQQQRQRNAAAAAAARLSSVDGGSAFPQERLGMPSPSYGSINNGSNMASMIMSSSANAASTGGAPSLGFNNSSSNAPLDLAQVLMATSQGGNAFGVGAAASLGMAPTSTQNAAELSRLITMLRGGGANYTASLGGLGGINASAVMSLTNSLAAVADPIGSSKVDQSRQPSIRKKRASKSKQATKTKKMKKSPIGLTIAPRPMPCVLYTKDDDDYLTPYQCLLRKQLEVFVADSEDVRCSSQQGRTTNIQVGQVGLRCRHCEGGLASRTKGAVYYSHSVDGMYQIGQNIGKVHLAERCYRIPDDIRRQLMVLRNDSRRASSGKVYWSERIRGLGVYQEGKILKYRSVPRTEDAKAGDAAGNPSVSAAEDSFETATKKSATQEECCEKPRADSAPHENPHKDSSAVNVTHQE
ncbi:MAG: hypothetical protein SGILL_009389 [Bacillariaceae sp.]